MKMSDEIKEYIKAIKENSDILAAEVERQNRIRECNDRAAAFRSEIEQIQYKEIDRVRKAGQDRMVKNEIKRVKKLGRVGRVCSKLNKESIFIRYFVEDLYQRGVAIRWRPSILKLIKRVCGYE